MNLDRLLELLIKKEQGIISLEEQRELSGMVHDESAYSHASNLVKSLFQAPLTFEKSIDKEFIDRTTEDLCERIKDPGYVNIREPRKLVSLKRVIAVAASLLIVFGFGYYFIFQKEYRTHEDKVSASIFTTKKGSKSSLILPDGTKVWINSDTKLTYNKSFGERSREVNLEGEAYFDVVKDSQRFFIVHTKTMDVKVLGTAFNVRAYKNEINTQATLVRGSVEVMLKNKNNEKITLQPNEKIIVQNTYTLQDSVTKANDNMPQITLMRTVPSVIDSGFIETQWTKSSLHFEQERLKDMIPVLENWYDVNFKVTETPLLNRKFSCTIENESLTEVLESFRLASGLKYKIDNDVVTIY